MNRSEFSDYILCKYNIKGDHPFSDDFDTCVFRHNDTKKWFALVMNIPKSKFISAIEVDEKYATAPVTANPHPI